MVCVCRQSGERLGECFLLTTKGGTDPSITNIYSLVLTFRELMSVGWQAAVGGWEKEGGGVRGVGGALGMVKDQQPVHPAICNREKTKNQGLVWLLIGAGGGLIESKALKGVMLGQCWCFFLTIEEGLGLRYIVVIIVNNQ